MDDRRPASENLTLSSKGLAVTADPSFVRIAHSPDADDAFMLFGIARGRVDLRGLDVRLETGDIETLNRRAVAGDVDVSAISFAAWPRIAERYSLLRVGSSFGLGHGPRIVAREPCGLDRLAGRRVAIPGELTTAALVLRLMLPGVATAVVPFDSIPDAVRAGEVDAGVVIHEGQLTHEAEGLSLVADLGAWWSEATGGLPLPLGANAVRRDLGRDLIEAVTGVFADSIRAAQEDREAALAHALAHGRGLDTDLGDRYVGMYVNELTLDPGPRGREAVEELYRSAATAGLLPAVAPRWA